MSKALRRFFPVGDIVVRDDSNHLMWWYMTNVTRENLRDLARIHGVKRGRNTWDTYYNLKNAGRIIPVPVSVTNALKDLLHSQR